MNSFDKVSSESENRPQGDEEYCEILARQNEL